MEHGSLSLFEPFCNTVFNTLRKVTQSDFKLAQMRPELVEILLDVFIHDLLCNIVSLLFIRDLNYCNDLLFIVYIEYGVVYNVLEKLVGHRFDLLLGAFNRLVAFV